MFTSLAAFSAGVGATCLFLFLAEFLRMVGTEPEAEKKAEEYEARRLPLLFRVFLPFASNVGFITRHEFLTNSRKNTEELIQSAGFDQALTAAQFIGVRILMGLAGTILLFLMIAADRTLFGFLLFGLFLLYPVSWLHRTIRMRHLSILKALPNVLDLLTLSVEAGKDFLTALRDILAKRKSDPLGDELKRTLHEIQLGKQRQMALKELGWRVRLPELTSIVNAVIQADELGIGIGQLLRIQGDQLRNKRFARAETLANEAPVKILFPVVLFIFPSVFIILIAPIISQALKTLSF
ncbi:MAG: Bacterial type II secretion system protein F domain protein [Lentisphaerae bacterium ADurb.Bin242]|nr:MAG: Bacterial type II secretion system protein F domain protein [Lentisphaerae bacterium ADurb.Bin242]